MTQNQQQGQISESFAPKEKASATRSILVIDDDQEILFLIKTLLEMNLYKVETVDNARQALDILPKIKKPDLILLDMNMADMTGLQFLEQFEKTLPELMEQTPVVLLSGVDQVPASKAVGFVQKPILDFDEFLSKINNFIIAPARH